MHRELHGGPNYWSHSAVCKCRRGLNEVGAKMFCENLLFPNTAYQLIKIALLGTLLHECTGTIGGQHSPNGCSCCCMCGKAETAAATGWVGQVCIQMWADVT